MLALICNRTSSSWKGASSRRRTSSATPTASATSSTPLHEDGELVAAEPGDERPPVEVAQPLGQRHQEPVADVVAEGVVDLLELVEVHHEQRGSLAGGREVGEHGPEAFVEVRAVGEAGEPVVQGEPPQLLLGQGGIGDVEGDALGEHRSGRRRGHDRDELVEVDPPPVRGLEPVPQLVVLDPRRRVQRLHPHAVGVVGMDVTPPEPRLQPLLAGPADQCLGLRADVVVLERPWTARPDHAVEAVDERRPAWSGPHARTRSPRRR